MAQGSTVPALATMVNGAHAIVDVNLPQLLSRLPTRSVGKRRSGLPSRPTGSRWSSTGFYQDVAERIYEKHWLEASDRRQEILMPVSRAGSGEHSACSVLRCGVAYDPLQVVSRAHVPWRNSEYRSEGGSMTSPEPRDQYPRMPSHLHRWHILGSPLAKLSASTTRPDQAALRPMTPHCSCDPSGYFKSRMR